MSNGVFVRLLVPKRGPDGKIEYKTELRWVRLPVKRDDRMAFVQRLTGEDD